MYIGKMSAHMRRGGCSLFNVDQSNKHKLDLFFNKIGAMITHLYHACNFLALIDIYSI